nr:MAG TPA: hypothetical protein [Caudoviricetes sp.]
MVIPCRQSVNLICAPPSAQKQHKELNIKENLSATFAPNREPRRILTFLNTLELRISHLSRLSPFRWAHSLSCSLEECPIVVYFSSLDSPRSELEGSYKRREGGNVPFGVLVLMIFFE